MNNQTKQLQAAGVPTFERLFAVQTRYREIGKITEYTVIKETEKTYTVEKTEELNNPATFWHNKTLVKKSNMEVYDNHFCESYAEALEYKTAILDEQITLNESEIARMTARNAAYRAAIDRTTAELKSIRGEK